MIPFEALFKDDHAKDHENGKCDGLLYRFQLNKVKRTSIFLKTYTICRYLEDVFEEGKPPANENNGDKPEIFAPRHVLKFQMTVPGEGHERIGDKQKQYRENSSHAVKDKNQRRYGVCAGKKKSLPRGGRLCLFYSK
jgi:hypothetical protein